MSTRYVRRRVARNLSWRSVAGVRRLGALGALPPDARRFLRFFIKNNAFLGIFGLKFLL